MFPTTDRLSHAAQPMPLGGFVHSARTSCNTPPEYGDPWLAGRWVSDADRWSPIQIPMAGLGTVLCAVTHRKAFTSVNHGTGGPCKTTTHGGGGA